MKVRAIADEQEKANANASQQRSEKTLYRQPPNPNRLIKNALILDGAVVVHSRMSLLPSPPQPGGLSPM